MKPLHPPDQVAPSTARRLLAALADVQVEGRLPSVVAGLVRDGHLVWTAGYGDVPGDPVDTQYKIGSITKTMTAVLVLQLVEERRIRLDSRIGEVLGNVGYADRTVRQLLAHVGGLQAEPDGPWWERSDNGPFDEADHGQVTPAHPVGRTWHYSNLAYGLLGELVARLRGEPWADALRSRVLEPLGMDRTTYDPQAPHAQGFSVHPYARTLLAEPNPDTGWMAPAGQLWSTVTDLATYTRFLLEGHPDVLPKPVLEEAFIPQSGALATGLGFAHGLGFQMFAGGSGTLIGHSGSMPGFVATCFVDRPRRTAVVGFGNGTAGMKPVPMAVRLLELLEQAEPTLRPAWRPVERVPEQLADLLGVWHWGYTPHVFELDGHELVVRKLGDVVYRFAVAPDGSVIGTAGHHHGERLRVVRNEDGSINHLDLRTFIFTRSPNDPEAPVPGGGPGIG